MDVNQHHRFLLPDASYLSRVKRDIARLAATAGFSETESGKVNIVVSEMASNLVRHVANGGEMLVRLLKEPDLTGIEIISLDRGPGMPEPLRMLQDGVSTYGSAGEGLGAIKRQSDFFDFYSQPETGSVVLSRIFKTVGLKPQKLPNLEIGAILLSKRIDDLSGDGWSIQPDPEAICLLALDGLGHGQAAHEASQKGIEVFNQSQENDLKAKLLEIHNGISHTRGAVGAIASISFSEPELTYCGIGNISARVFAFSDAGTMEVTKSLMSYNGTLGHIIPGKFHEQKTAWHPGNLLLMHSDGLRSQADLSLYPKLFQHDATLIAAVLFRDYTRGTDDSLVLIAKAKH